MKGSLTPFCPQNDNRSEYYSEYDIVAMKRDVITIKKNQLKEAMQWHESRERW